MCCIFPSIEQLGCGCGCGRWQLLDLVALPGLEPGLFALRGRRVNQLHHNAKTAHPQEDILSSALTKYSKPPGRTQLNGNASCPQGFTVQRNLIRAIADNLPGPTDNARKINIRTWRTLSSLQILLQADEIVSPPGRCHRIAFVGFHKAAVRK